jgi:DNA primase
VGRIKDRGLRQLYAVSLDRWLGMMDEGFVLNRVLAHGTVPEPRSGRSDARQHGNSSHAPGADGRPSASQAGAPQSHGQPGSAYDRHDPVVLVERQALKLAIQRPALCGPVFDELSSLMFTVPAHAAVCELIAANGGVASARSAREWSEQLRAAAPNDNARGFVTRLAVEPIEVPGATGEPDAKFVEGVLARVEELAVSRDIARIKSQLQRMSPVTEPGYNRLFGDLVALEGRKKVLAERAGGAL